MFFVIFIAKAASVLQSRLLGDGDQWAKAVMTWSRLQAELADRRTTVNAPSTARGVSRKREEGEKCDVESRKSTVEQREESGNGRLRSGEQNGAQTLEKKRKREKEERGVEEVRDVERKREEGTRGGTCVEDQTLEKKRKRDDEEEEESRGAARDSSSEKNVEREKTSERERRREGEEEREIVMEFSSGRKNGKHGVISGIDFSGRDHATPGLDHNVESSSSRMDNTAKDFAVESLENGNKMDHFHDSFQFLFQL